MIKLPKWLPISILEDIFEHLKPYGDSRLVGGCVREILLGHISNDIDIATQALPEEVYKTLKKAGYKCFDFGISYGTITVIQNEQKFEITSLRSDIKTYGRKAEVEFCRDWQEDAKRRDFTINAMFLDLRGNLYDYHNGETDLKKGVVRFIGNASARIKEDYLRILRYFRFLAYLPNSKIDEESYKTCKDEMDNVLNLSAERIKSELFKILGLERASVAITNMANAGFFTKVLGIQLKIDNSLTLSSEPIVNFVYLLYLSNIESTSHQLLGIGSILKLSNQEKRIIKILLDGAHTKHRIEKKFQHVFLYKHGIDNYHYFMRLLLLLEPKTTFNLISKADIPIFPINGEDLKACGYHGKELGEKLKKLEQIWINSDFKFSKQELLSFII